MEQYSWRERGMHAVLALMVTAIFFVGLSFSYLPKSLRGDMVVMHKSFGLIFLSLMCVRIYFIIKDGRPDLPSSVASWQKYAARTIQFVLYLLLFAMPMSGYLMSNFAAHPIVLFNVLPISGLGIEHNPGLAHFFKEAHEWMAWILGFVVVLHVSGGLKHYFYDKDRVLQSMWFFRK